MIMRKILGRYVIGEVIVPFLIIFEKLIKRLSAPVGFSRLGNDILPFSNKLNMGQLGRRGQKYSNKLLKSADVVLVLGCRLATPLGGENLNHFSKSCKIIMIEIDKNEIDFLKKHLYRTRS